ncbi:MAG TPA: exodeoxyribonuclease VII small subunit [Steroidobacteraceae bacterium]|nr:exodeoxyribonuclease VII small subunit [Steroidobacteraceae bacterium]
MTRKTKEIPFEQTLTQLEALVTQLESGDLPLEEALRLFERGVQLTRECQQALESARLRVQVLTQQAGQARLEDFQVDADDEDHVDPE